MLKLQEYNTYVEQEILALYNSVRWTNYTSQPQILEIAYKNSLYILAAYVDSKLVGIIRAVGDGSSIVFLQDLIVLPEYQRKGIGTRLMKSTLDKFARTYQIVLLTEKTEKNICFYRSLGLLNVENIGCSAFIVHRFLN